jgi:hypothetical protein
MQIDDIFAETGGLKSMARDLGISEAQAGAGAAALTPAILGGFKKQAQSQPAGLDGLGGWLGKLGGGGLLDDVVSPEPTNVSRGNNLLGEIFGSKDVSRAVAQNAAAQSGLDTSVLKKMLPMLAMLVGGYMAKRSAGSTAASTPMPADRSPTGRGIGGMLKGMFGDKSASDGAATGERSSGLASMLDLDRDGNPLDDILRKVGIGKR